MGTAPDETARVAPLSLNGMRPASMKTINLRSNSYGSDEFFNNSDAVKEYVIIYLQWFMACMIRVMIVMFLTAKVLKYFWTLFHHHAITWEINAVVGIVVWGFMIVMHTWGLVRFFRFLPTRRFIPFRFA